MTAIRNLEKKLSDSNERTNRLSVDPEWFQCPVCDNSVQRKPDGLHCTKCCSLFPEIDSIPLFASGELEENVNREKDFWEHDRLTDEKGTFHTFSGNAYHQMIDQINIPARGVGLDFACGSGAFGSYLDQHTVVGLDISLSLLRASKGIIPVQGSGMKLPFQSNLFDFAICAAALHHMPDPELALSEVIRTIKPEGVVGILELNLSHPQRKLIADSRSPFRKLFPTSGFSPSERLIKEEDLVYWLKKYGCQVKETHYVSPEYRKVSPFGRIQSLTARTMGRGKLGRYFHSYLIIRAIKLKQ